MSKGDSGRTKDFTWIESVIEFFSVDDSNTLGVFDPRLRVSKPVYLRFKDPIETNTYKTSIRVFVCVRTVSTTGVCPTPFTPTLRVMCT